jgi:hypothetical protein
MGANGAKARSPLSSKEYFFVLKNDLTSFIERSGTVKLTVWEPR